MPVWLTRLLALLRQPVSLKEGAPEEARAMLEAQEEADAELRREKEERAAAATPSQAIRDLLLRGFAAILGVLGLGGSVAVVGGAILWIRFSEAHLPANQALEAVPNDQLIITGAVALIGFSIAALAGILLIFALDPRGQVTGGSIAGLGALLAGGVLYAWLEGELPAIEVLLLSLLGLILAAACLGIAERTGVAFLPFAAAVFVSVMIFAAVLNLRIAHDRAEVQPAAVLRGPSDEGITGVYVTDTDDHIYIGRWQEEPKRRALFRIERDEQTQLAIGDALPQGEQAKEEAQQLLGRLRSDADKLGKAPTKRTPKEVTEGE